MVITDPTAFLIEDSKLNKMLFIPEISSDQSNECNVAIRIDSIQAIMVERVYFFNGAIYSESEISAKVREFNQYKVFILSVFTKERKYYVSSFYKTNFEPNFLLNVLQFALQEGKEINWEEVRNALAVYKEVK